MNVTVKSNFGIKITYFLLLIIFATLLQGHLVEQVILFLFISISTILKKKHDFSSPYGFFIVIYSLYSVSYPLHNIINYIQYDVYVYGSLFLHTLGLIGFILSGSVIKDKDKDKDKDTIIDLHINKNNHIPVFCIWFFGFLCTLLFIYKVAISGASNKQELSSDAGGILYYAVLIYILSSSYITMKFVFMEKKKAWIFVFFNTVVLFCAYLYSGERDVIFKYIFFMVIFLFDYKWIFKKKYYLILVSSILVILPLSQFYKAAMLSQNADTYTIDTDSIFVGEFISSGRNTAKLLEYNDKVKDDLIPGERVVYDIFRFFRVKKFDDFEIKSSGAWFNDTVLPAIGVYPNSGWGFSWVGFLYSSLGYLGPFVGMFFLGCSLKLAYELRYTSPYKYLFYIMFLSISLYIQRADLANLLGQVIKFTIIPLILISILSRFSLGKKYV